MKSDEAYTGFEIDLWEGISKELGLEFVYYETNMDGIFRDLIAGKAHVAFSCITITHAREELVDFSHHTLDSGLRILVSNKKAFSLIEPVKSLFSILPQFFIMPGMKRPEKWLSSAIFLICNITDSCFPKVANSGNRSTGRC
jgi:ABC-type amino acid transport substrate-binding protein